MASLSAEFARLQLLLRLGRSNRTAANRGTPRSKQGST